MSFVRKGELVIDTLYPVFLIAALFLAMHVVLTWRHPHSDQVLLPSVAILVELGLTLVSRLAPASYPRQIAWITLGVALALLIMLLPGSTHWLKRYKYTWAALGLGLVAITIVFGVDPNGSGVRLWLGHGDFLFQPSEILKVLSVLFVASYLDDKKELITLDATRVGPVTIPPIPYLMPLLTMWGVSVLLLIGQKDLGPPFLLFGVFLAMLYAATSRSVYLFSGIILLFLAAYGSYHFLSYAHIRIDVWLNPWADALGKGYQNIQGLVAFAAGGVFGSGLGFGYPLLIPAVSTDFPMAAIGEEMGLLGTMAVMLTYLLLTYRGLKVALEVSDTFHQLMALGLAITVGLQAIIIMAGNLKLIPLTGITLPFISYGGSSLVANFVILGLLLRISDDARGAP